MPKILVTGCLHAEWDLLLDKAEELISKGTNIELILVNGDAETFRNADDMLSFAAPLKFHILGTFHKIASGERKPPCPIVIVGGNHETSDLFFQLPFGGYIAPNVYYVGRAAQLLFGDILISAVSGLYSKEKYYEKVDEVFPLRTKEQIHSSYSIRAFSDFQLLALSKTQIMLSHDWPSTIPLNFASSSLKKIKPCLIESDKKGTFGLPLGMKIIEKLKPRSYFAAHHHFTMTAKINEDTMFYALPKPTRYDWFMVVDVEGTAGPLKISGEWMSILKATNDLMENPELLKCNWTEEWEKRKPKEVLEAVDVEPFNPDPVATTIAFCRKYGIYCPNPEIRAVMDQQ